MEQQYTLNCLSSHTIPLSLRKNNTQQQQNTKMASAEASTQELATFSHTNWQDSNEDQPEQQQDFQSLPPADSGKDAYLFLAACVGLEALVWGFPFAVSEPLFDDEGMTTNTCHSSVCSRFTTTIMSPSPTRAAAQVLVLPSPASCTSWRHSLR